MHDKRDTIVALSTPYGRSAIGVIRISGPGGAGIAERAIRRALRPRIAIHASWCDSTGAVIDDVIVTLFPSPHSYTGEDVIEIGGHGNPFVLQRLIDDIRRVGARLAEPGEFTWRAVANGKMDLIQAEAVRDFIEAQTEDQARTALRQIEGALSKRIHPIKDRLVDVIAFLEASIDFVEDDLEIPDTASRVRLTGELASELRALATTFDYGRLLNSGLRLVIAGKPNVGKSSLFNRLLGADRAIVADIPGTTRDLLSETAAIGGIPIRYCDTAGIREAKDVVEGLGVERSLDAVSEADFVLVVLDASQPLDDDDARILSLVRGISHLVVLNKCDLEERSEHRDLSAVRVSARTGAGFRELEAVIEERLVKRPAGEAEGILTNARQHEATLNAVAALDRGSLALGNGTPSEMALLDFYVALRELNTLTGEVVTEDILGRVFSRFCVGK